MKIIRVDCCFRCPRFRICPIKEGCACEAVSPERCVTNPDKIPAWCPLPDAKDPFRTDLIALLVRRGHKGKEIVEMVREIEALLDGQRCEWTEEDELRRDAGLWRKVEEIAKRNWYDGYPCDGCPVENCCDSADSLCGQADALVQALIPRKWLKVWREGKDVR